MSRRGWVAFATVAILWGVPYLFIKVAVSEVSPVFVAWVRLVIAAALEPDHQRHRRAQEAAS